MLSIIAEIQACHPCTHTHIPIHTQGKSLTKKKTITYSPKIKCKKTGIPGYIKITRKRFNVSFIEISTAYFCGLHFPFQFLRTNNDRKIINLQKMIEFAYIPFTIPFLTKALS